MYMWHNYGMHGLHVDMCTMYHMGTYVQRMYDTCVKYHYVWHVYVQYTAN